YHDPEHYAEQASRFGQEQRLDEKLKQNVVGARAHGLADADLPRPFRHRNQHDVHDHDTADHQRDGGDPDHGVKKRAAKVRPDTQQAVIGLDVEIVVVAGVDVAAGAEDGARLVHRFIESGAAGRGLARDADTFMGAMLFLISADRHERVVIQALAKRLAFAFADANHAIDPAVDTNLL